MDGTSTLNNASYPHNQVAYMYILECSDGTYYTGSTLDLGKRLWEHQNGLGANYTRKRRPVRLSYCEPYDRVEDAFLREKHVQGWSRAKKEALMAGDLPRLVLLARNRDSGPPPLTVASTSSATGTLAASTQDDAVAEPVEARSLSLSKRGR